MDVKTYNSQLFEQIPISQNLGLQIRRIDKDQVILSAPLQQNINYEGTVFGGSLNTAALLSCYLMTHHLLQVGKVTFTSLVIQKSHIDYVKPTRKDFEAQCFAPSKDKWNSFLKSLNKKSIGRIEMSSQILCEGLLTVQFSGTFVAGL